MTSSARKIDSIKQHYQQTVKIQEKVVHEFPEALERVKELASYYLNLGNFQRNTRKLKEAEDHYRKALAIREKHAGETPESFTNQVSLGAVNCEYGVLLRMADKPEAGLPLLNKAVAILQTAYEKEPRLLNTQRYLRPHDTVAAVEIRLLSIQVHRSTFPFAAPCDASHHLSEHLLGSTATGDIPAVAAVRRYDGILMV